LTSRKDCLIKEIKRRENFEKVHICTDCCDIICLGFGSGPSCPNRFSKMYSTDRGFRNVRVTTEKEEGK
jgi:hypothetical protein